MVGGMFAMGWEALLTLAADPSLEPHAVIISIIQTELKMLDFFSKIISFFLSVSKHSSITTPL